MVDFSLGDILNGGAVITSLYLAFQIKAQLGNHEVRISNLEKTKGSGSKKAKRARPSSRRARKSR